MSFRSVPTVQNVTHDAVGILAENDKESIWQISIADGKVSVPQLKLEFAQDDIHEIGYLETTDNHSVPGRNSVGGLPLYTGTASIHKSIICLYLRSDVQKCIEISCIDTLECELDGRRWTVPLSDKIDRNQRVDEIRNTFQILRPIVRKMRINREIDKLCRGEVVDFFFEEITFHKQKVEYKKLKSGFFNKLANRKDTLSSSYSDVTVKVEGDEYAPKKVTLSFYGYPDNDKVYIDENRNDYGKQYLFKPIIEHMKGNVQNSPATVIKKENALRLKELRELLNQGLLTTEEHDKKRSEIINGI